MNHTKLKEEYIAWEKSRLLGVEKGEKVLAFSVDPYESADYWIAKLEEHLQRVKNDVDTAIKCVEKDLRENHTDELFGRLNGLVFVAQLSSLSTKEETK